MTVTTRTLPTATILDLAGDLTYANRAAFKAAVECGRDAYEIGVAQPLDAASATSPLTGFLDNE